MTLDGAAEQHGVDMHDEQAERAAQHEEAFALSLLRRRLAEERAEADEYPWHREEIEGPVATPRVPRREPETISERLDEDGDRPGWDPQRRIA